MRVKATAQHLLERLAQRPPEYLSEIEPAITQHFEDGSIEFETDHPAWKSAVSKYAPVRPRANDQSRGLGDTLHKLLENLHVSPLVKRLMAAAGKECGCDKRREWLNQKFQY